MNVVFKEIAGEHVGIGPRGRRWRVVRSVSGWRLEFRDAGDTEYTYAGTHGTLEQALAEAER
jgi:hypothetical protein